MAGPYRVGIVGLGVAGAAAGYLPAAFEALRRRQRAYVRYNATVMWFLSPFFQSDWRVLGCGRDRALPWLPYIPVVRRQMLMTVAGLKGGFLKGRITV